MKATLPLMIPEQLTPHKMPPIGTGTHGSPKARVRPTGPRPPFGRPKDVSTSFDTLIEEQTVALTEALSLLDNRMNGISVLPIFTFIVGEYELLGNSND